MKAILLLTMVAEMDWERFHTVGHLATDNHCGVEYE